MSELNIIKSYLKYHDYYIKVYQTDFGCAVNFPQFFCTSKYTKSYNLLYQGLEKKKYDACLYMSIENDILNVNTIIESPSYSLRILTFCDILAEARKIQYDRRLLVYLDKEGDEIKDCSVADILAKPEEGLLNKERKLANVLVDVFKNGFNEENEATAKMDEIVDGYNIIKNTNLVGG